MNHRETQSFKQLLREEIILDRNNISEQERKAYAKIYFTKSKERIDELMEKDSNTKLFLYKALKDEIDTSKLLEHYSSYFIASIRNKPEKSFFSVIGEGEIGKLGEEVGLSKLLKTMSSTESTAIVLLPSLCVDINNNRLGRGRAWYDYFLRMLTEKQIKTHNLTYVRKIELLPMIPVEKHDIAVDFVGTLSIDNH
jgi:5,10-methenyltetrahydrofolate synthetase